MNTRQNRLALAAVCAALLPAVACFEVREGGPEFAVVSIQTRGRR